MQAQPNQPPPPQPQRYLLEPPVQLALGKVSPELAWLQLKTLVQQAIELNHDQSKALADKLNWPLSLEEMSECLGLMNPVRGLNELLYINPQFNLQSIPQGNPLKALEAVLRMYLVSDRFQYSKGLRQSQTPSENPPLTKNPPK